MAIDGNPFWACFSTVPDADGIGLVQVDKKRFRLAGEVTYHGDTNLTTADGRLRPRVRESNSLTDQELIERICTVSPATLPETDLASVPGPLLWLVPRYGKHTPAALLHDRLIGSRPDDVQIADWAADRFFRAMLGELRIRPVNRWLMWAAVALRTRWKARSHRLVKRIGLLVFAVAALAGNALFGLAIADRNWALLAVTLLVPVVLSPLCFWRQWGAGLIAAAGAPLVLPPAVVAVLAFGLYLGVEGVFVGLGKLARAVRRRPGDAVAGPGVGALP